MTCPNGTVNVVSLRTLPRETKHSVSCGASQLMGYSSTENIFSVLSIDTSLLIFIHVHLARTKSGVVALHEPYASPSQPRVTSQPRVNHESSQFFYFVPKKKKNEYQEKI